jgi:acyl-CoA thioester hydrolase
MPSTIDLDPIPSSVMTIRFQDCDPFNHLNNGRYMDYFLNAREDHIQEHYGLDIYGTARESGRSWVVSTTQIAFLRPALLMEKVVVESQLIGFGPKHVQVEMRMWDAARTVLKSFCWMGFVHFDLRKGGSLEYGPEYRELFTKVHRPVAERGFDERLSVLKRPA